MNEIQVVEAPFALKDQIKRQTFNTYEDHRARQPFAFSQNQFALYVEPGIDASFMDTAGKPCASSPNIFVAMQGDVLCGYVVLSESSNTTWPRVNINDIFVVEAFRGQGIGRRLLEHVKELSLAKNWDNLTAQVWHGNDTSAALFRAGGFVPQSEFLRFGPAGQARDLPAPAKGVKPARLPKPLIYLIIAIVAFIVAHNFGRI